MMGRLSSSKCSLRASNACLTVTLPCSLKGHIGSHARQLQSQRSDGGRNSHLPPLLLMDEHSLAERPPWALHSQSSWELLEALLQAVASGLAQAGCTPTQQPLQASCKRCQQGLGLAILSGR